MAAACTDSAAEYANQREQFGRVIGTFQAVKHHCANMAVATELATSAVWDAAKAAATGGDQQSFSAAVAATLAAPRRTSARTSTPRSTAASRSPGSTTPTSTCAGRPRCWATCARRRPRRIWWT
ncbi:MAG: acyl-CoA/acyl-ACP dehydrogenase [Microthrixaceae bacterium]|nr:acyl-CoA/acyl-ACP dehydrogenase [Microthrixaceae bacterium]